MCRQGLWGVIDRTGKQVVDYVGIFNEGLAPVRIDQKLGFIDTRGRVRVPCRYEKGEGFSSGLAAVLVPKDSTGAIPETVRWGYIDPSGAWVIPPRFYEAKSLAGACAEVETKSGNIWRRGYVGRDGHWVLLRIPCVADN